MEDKLIRVFHNQLVGKEYIGFDLYNAKGILVHSKNQKISSDFLLMASYIAVYKKEIPLKEFKKDEVSLFLKELMTLAVKKEVDNIQFKCSIDNITISLFKNLSILEKSDIDGSFYPEILNRIKNLFDIEIDLDKEEYNGSSKINVFNKNANLNLHMGLNYFNRFNMIFEILGDI